MDLIAWIGRLIFFLAILWIALENPATVPLHLTATMSWSAVPLLAVILGSFVVGVLAGTIAMLPKLFRLHRRLRRASADLKAPRQNVEASLMHAARHGGAAVDVDFDASRHS